MKRIKTLLKDLLISKRASLLCLFVLFLVFNLMGSAVYAQSNLFSKNSYLALKVLHKTKSSSSQNITAMSFDQDSVRPDHSSPKNPDFFDFYTIADDLYVSSKKLSSDVAFDDEVLISSFPGKSHSRAPPISA